MSRLEEIVAELEEGDEGLDDALAKYEEGASLARLCLDRLREAELRVKQVSLEDDDLS